MKQVRYFYTDPIKAAWMAQEFGIKYENFIYDMLDDDRAPTCQGYSGFDDILFENEKFKLARYSMPLIVHPDSHAALQPKVGDIILDYDNDPREITGVRNNMVFWLENEDYGYCYIQDIKIIQREGKAWFSPEREEV